MKFEERSRFRFLDAKEISHDLVNFDGLGVYNRANEKLGSVDGFVANPDTGQLYYVVVDSGGWFSSRHYLVPVGHATLDAENKVLVFDLDKDRIRRFPEYDPERFARMSDDELRLFERRMLEACCPEEAASRTDEATEFAYGRWAHYREPNWLTGRRVSGTGVTHPRTAAATPLDTPAERVPERMVARESEPASPGHLERAQPGDVLGLERGGETTSLGDTAADEDRRRVEAEKNAERFERDEREERVRKDRDKGRGTL
jgi:hypothetical protein